MNSAHIVISLVAKTALLAALAGVIVRRRYRVCAAFVAYLIVIAASDTLTGLWPDRFYVKSFWIMKQAVWDLAKLAVGLELAYRTLRAFPGARPLAQLVLATVLAITTGAVLSLPPAATYSTVVFDWQPRVITGTIWLMTALALIVVWHRLPIHPFQRAILIGFVPYLVVFTSLLNVLRQHGWEARPWVNVADAFAYGLVLTWWAYAAWRRDEPAQVSPEVARQLGLEH